MGRGEVGQAQQLRVTVRVRGRQPEAAVVRLIPDLDRGRERVAARDRADEVEPPDVVLPGGRRVACLVGGSR